MPRSTICLSPAANQQVNATPGREKGMGEEIKQRTMGLTDADEKKGFKNITTEMEMGVGALGAKLLLKGNSHS